MVPHSVLLTTYRRIHFDLIFPVAWGRKDSAAAADKKNPSKCRNHSLIPTPKHTHMTLISPYDLPSISTPNTQTVNMLPNKYTCRCTHTHTKCGRERTLPTHKNIKINPLKINNSHFLNALILYRKLRCNFPLCFVGKVLEQPDALEAKASQIIKRCCAENGTLEGEEKRGEEQWMSLIIFLGLCITK